MEKKYPVRIGDLLKANLSNNDSFKNGIKESTIMKSWLEIVGRDIAEETIKLYIRDRKLYVGFASPAARSEFYIMRKSVLYKLNGKVGEVYLKLIIVV